MLYPLEFLVAETPIPAQNSGRSKARWKEIVKAAARRRIRQTDEFGFLEVRPLSLTIYYFAPAAMEGDVDNLVKPIMDALIHVAYMDDSHIERVVIQKFEPGVDWDFENPGEGLEAALATDPPVVYIRVDDHLRWRRL
jgi:Holliday junction resolvase RusA-like endonuclease